jgi:hypothetical protein
VSTHIEALGGGLKHREMLPAADVETPLPTHASTCVSPGRFNRKSVYGIDSIYHCLVVVNESIHSTTYLRIIYPHTCAYIYISINAKCVDCYGSEVTYSYACLAANATSPREDRSAPQTSHRLEIITCTYIHKHIY